MGKLETDNEELTKAEKLFELRTKPCEALRDVHAELEELNQLYDIQEEYKVIKIHKIQDVKIFGAVRD